MTDPAATDTYEWTDFSAACTRRSCPHFSAVSAAGNVGDFPAVSAAATSAAADTGELSGVLGATNRSAMVADGLGLDAGGNALKLHRKG